jgi:hypothetical protein
MRLLCRHRVSGATSLTGMTAMHGIIGRVIESGRGRMADFTASQHQKNSPATFILLTANRQRRGIPQRARFCRLLGSGSQGTLDRGKQTLWKIPRRGNQYQRRLFVQGARAVMQHRTKQSSGLSAWLAQLTARTHQNISIVALATDPRFGAQEFGA